MSDQRAPEARPLAGTPYDLVRLVGRGSMGEVYEAVHRTLGKRRAVKVLAAHLVNRPDLAERMRVEAQLLANIRHPNLVEVVDLGVSSDGRLYFVMDLLEGHTLRRTIEANSPMRASLALELVIPILDGLAAAHAAGVVHRDVKPENVFVLAATGDIKVLDFGVAKVGLTAATVTKTSFTAGTPRYMAPEQVDGGTSDPRTDLFACGALLYELLTGHGPFDRAERMALAFAILTAEPPPMESPHRISRRLRDAVSKALQKKKDDRFATADAMATELRACLAEERGVASTTVSLPPVAITAPVSAGPVSAPVSVAPASAAAMVEEPQNGGRGLIVGVVVGLVIVAGVAAVVGWRWAGRGVGPAGSAATIVVGSSPSPSPSPSTSTSAAPSVLASAAPTSTVVVSATARASVTVTAATAASATASVSPRASATVTATPVEDAGLRRPGSGL